MASGNVDLIHPLMFEPENISVEEEHKVVYKPMNHQNGNVFYVGLPFSSWTHKGNFIDMIRVWLDYLIK